MPLSKFLNNKQEQAPVNAAGASSAYNPFAKLLEDNFMLNEKIQSNTLDYLTSETGVSNKPLNIDADKYSDYDVYINDVQTQQELDKERANNQTALEQSGRALVNAAAEVLLGIPIGFADIGDALLNVNNSQNDYQNVISSTLTEWKEAINERMKVYQENPDEAFNGSDWGWWMSHAPSIVTSISLMIPALGVSGALGKIGSIVGKTGRALSRVNALKPFNSVANKFNVFSKMSQQTRDTLGAMAKAGIEGATMRVGENYLEARETFNQIEDYATKEFASMSKEERDEFFNNNPQYKGWNDEDIIKDIASNSADITFKSDLINGVFDIIQIYGMRNMWNNRITRDLTGSASLNRLNKLTAKMFGQDAKAIQEAAKGGSMLAKTKIGITDFLDNSFRLARTEWTEGIEEAINYVSSQEGIYAGKKVFDKNINPNTLEDYLRDPFMWESALWGLIGGVVFGQAYPATMKGIGKLNAKRLGQDFITAEKQKEAEIYSRIAITENYVNELTKIESGKNPFDNDAEIDDNEKESLKELAGKRYIDALVTNAANAGNLDLLESFMHDNNFNKGFREKLGINEEESNKILTQFDKSFAETKQTYMDVLNKASRGGASFEVAKIIASDAVDAKHGIETWNTLKNNAQKKFDSLVSQSHLAEEVGSYIEDAKDGIVINEIDAIRKKIGILEKNTAVKEKDRKTSILKLQKDIERLNKIRNVESIDDLNKKIKLEAARRLYKEQKEIYDSYIQLAQRENVVLYAKENNKTDDITIKNKIQELNNFFDSARKKVVDGAFEDMTKMYRKYGKNVINEYLDKKTGEIEEADT